MTCPIQHNKKHSVQLSLIFIQGVLQNMRNEHGISLTLSIQGVLENMIDGQGVPLSMITIQGVQKFIPEFIIAYSIRQIMFSER